MGLTKAALERPVFILMLMLCAFLIGGISYTSMRKEQNPEVNFGVVTVSTAYPGAGPDDINELISRKVEEAVSGVNGIREVTSISQEGVSVVTVQLEIGVDTDVAMNDVRSKVDAIVNDLPTDALKPTISKFDNSAGAVMTMAFSSDKLTSAELRDLMDDKIIDRFAQIPGVASANVQGGDVREIQVQVKKDKLLAYGLGIADVQQAVAAGSVNAPAGKIVNGAQEYTVRVKNDYENADQIKNMVISVTDPKAFGGKARSVRLSDIADVKDTVEERDIYSRLDGHDTISLSISKAKDGNAVEIVDAAKKVLTSVADEYKSDGIKVTTTTDTSKLILNSLEDLQFSLFFGVFLVAIIVYVFLHNFRGMLIVAISIPTSIFAAFIVMKLFGFTINNMSMLSLSLAVGVLVDDAIVVIENIYRHLRMGEDPKTAAIRGRSEIGLAALAITLADVVVFLPIAFMGGIVGQFFKPLALGFVFATLFSLFVSFTVTPLLASRWYRQGEDLEHPTGKFAVWFEKQFGKLERGYKRGLEWSLNHRWFVFTMGNVLLLAVIAFIIGSTVAPKAPLGATGADANPIKFGIAGAVMGAAPLFMAAIFVGLMIVAINSLLAAKPTTKQIVRYASLILGTLMGLGLAIKGLAGGSPILMVFLSLVGGMIIGSVIPVLIGGLLRSLAHPKLFRFVAFAAMFGMFFPVASIVGYSYAQYKQTAVFKGGFLPDSDQGSVTAAIELAPGSSLERTQKVVAEVEKIFETDPDVKYVLSSVGTQGFGGFGGSSSGSNYGQVAATLWDKAAFLDKFKHQDEKLRWDRSSDEVAADLTYKVGKIPGASVKISASGGFGFGAAIQLSFTGDDRTALLKTVEKVRDGLAAGAVKGVINPDITSKPGKPELRVIPDPKLLADQGLTAAQVGAAIRTLYQGDDNTKMRVNGREYTVRTMMNIDDRNNPNLLNQVPVKFSQGTPIYLSSVAKTDTGPGIDKINRRNRSEEIQVTADLLPGYANGTVSAEIDSWIAKEKLVPDNVHYRALGQADAQKREGLYMISALFMGLILVYMLLASLYNNVLYPFIIQLAQPQAMVGALLALIIMNKSLNLVGFIGIVTLVGLVGKNAILLVDYTNTLRERGRKRHDAIVEAGPVRLRPIMMTTLALISGMLPVALAIGRGSEFRETIGITIIGGITLSTVLTLFVIPASYTIFDDLSTWIGPKMKMLKNNDAGAAQPELPIDAEDKTETVEPSRN